MNKYQRAKNNKAKQRKKKHKQELNSIIDRVLNMLESKIKFKLDRDLIKRFYRKLTS